MNKMVAYFVISCGLNLVTQGCAPTSYDIRSYGFAQIERGNWTRVGLDNLKNYDSSAKIVCDHGRVEFLVAWNAESGDWTAVDEYSSGETYFSRTIRFAQFDETITVIKRYKYSSPVIKINGDNASQYDYLLSELKIWTRRDEVPFDLPICANMIFDNLSAGEFASAATDTQCPGYTE